MWTSHVLATLAGKTAVWATAVVLFSLSFHARADDLEQVRRDGVLRVAVYNDFSPFSHAGKGIDVDLAQALAEKLGVKADVVGFNADEDMADDLRNMVWRGHYLGYRVAHVMLHVPVDPVLIEQNRRVRIFAPYYNEQIVVVRSLHQVPVFHGLEAFTRIRIGVEGGTLPHSYLLGAMGGRFRENVRQFKTIPAAVEALKAGELGAIMGSRSQIEAAVGPISGAYQLTPFTGAGLSVRSWDLGLAVKTENGELAQALEAALAELKQEGRLERIFTKHGVSYQAPAVQPQR